MSVPHPHVAVCVECRGLAEPPLDHLLDPYGLPTRHVVCQECREKILLPEQPMELGGEG